MSRKYFPRVALHTSPRPSRPPKLPPLLVAIFHNGELWRIHKELDPREKLIEEMHKAAIEMGLDMSAYPINDECEVVKPVRRGRKAGAK